MNDAEQRLARQLGECLRKLSLRCAVAESCTGGRIAAALTDIAGSSQWFDRGYVTYSNQAKKDMLGVSDAILMSHGAVSEATVRLMAEGALTASRVDLTVAVSGVAGPSGGSIEKPVGLVWVAWAGFAMATEAASYVFQGSRDTVRAQAVCVAIEGLIQRCNSLKEIQ